MHQEEDASRLGGAARYKKEGWANKEQAQREHILQESKIIGEQEIRTGKNEKNPTPEWRNSGISKALQLIKGEALQSIDKARGHLEQVQKFIQKIGPAYSENITKKWIHNIDEEEKTLAEKNIQAALEGIEELTKEGRLTEALQQDQDVQEYINEPMEFYNDVKYKFKIFGEKEQTFSPHQHALSHEIEKIRHAIEQGNLQSAYDTKENISEFLRTFPENTTSDIRKKYIHHKKEQQQGRREKEMGALADNIDAALTQGNILEAKTYKEQYDTTIGMYERYTKSLEKKYLADIYKTKKRSPLQQNVLEAVSTIQSKVTIGRLDEVDEYIARLEEYLEAHNEPSTPPESQSELPETSDKEKTEINQTIVQEYITGTLDVELLNLVLSETDSPIAQAFYEKYGVSREEIKTTVLAMIEKSMLSLNELGPLVKGTIDRDIIKAAAARQPDILRDQYGYTYKNGEYITVKNPRFVPEYFLDDIEIMRDAVIKAPDLLFKAEDSIQEELLKDPKIAHAMVETNGGYLEHMPEQWQDDKELVKKAIENYNHAITFASERLKDDETLVKLAITKRGIQDITPGKNFAEASARLRGEDKTMWPTTIELLNIALQTDPNAYKHLDPLFLAAPEHHNFLYEKISEQDIKKSLARLIDIGMSSDQKELLLQNQELINKFHTITVKTAGDVSKLAHTGYMSEIMAVVQSEIDRLEENKPKGILARLTNRKQIQAITQQIRVLEDFQNHVLITPTANAGRKLTQIKERQRQHEHMTARTGKSTIR